MAFVLWLFSLSVLGKWKPAVCSRQRSTYYEQFSHCSWKSVELWSNIDGFTTGERVSTFPSAWFVLETASCEFLWDIKSSLEKYEHLERNICIRNDVNPVSKLFEHVAMQNVCNWEIPVFGSWITKLTECWGLAETTRCITPRINTSLIWKGLRSNCSANGALRWSDTASNPKVRHWLVQTC